MSPVITEADIESRRELIAAEMAIRDQFAKDMDAVARNAEEMMKGISRREGVDICQYDIDWLTGETRLKNPRLEEN